MACRNCGKDTSTRSTICVDCANQTLGFYSKSSDSDSPGSSEPAGFWLRFIAYIIDASIIGFVFYLFNLVFFLCFGSELYTNFVEPFVKKMASDTPMQKSLFLAIFPQIMGYLLVMLLINLIIGFIYYVFFETSKLKATPGKIILGLEVLDDADQAITPLAAVVRHLSKQLFFITFGISHILAGITAEKQALHDLITKTYVQKGTNHTIGRVWIGIGAAIVCLIIYYGLPNFKNSGTTKNHGSYNHTVEYK